MSSRIVAVFCMIQTYYSGAGGCGLSAPLAGDRWLHLRFRLELQWLRRRVRLPPHIQQQHEAPQNHDGRDQHDNDPEVQHTRALGLLRCGRAETHHALRKRARSSDRRKRQNPFHWTLMCKARIESGMKISIRMMHSTSIGNSVRNRLSLSNFRCMKYAMISAA